MGKIEEWSKNRIAKNKNLMGIFIGETGSGKTYAAMKFCKDLDPEFDIDRIAINNQEFMHIVSKGLPKGSAILYDEAGVGMSHKEWMSTANKAINFVLQTFRHRNYIVIFTSPNFGFVEKGSRSMFHLMFKMHDIDFKNKLSYANTYMIHTNQINGDVYLKKFRDIQGNKIGRKAFGLPSERMIEHYEKKKTMYTTKLMNLMKAQVDDKDIFSDMTDLQREIYEDYYIRNMTQNEIAAKYKINQSAVSRHIKAVKTKGYDGNAIISSV